MHGQETLNIAAFTPRPEFINSALTKKEAWISKRQGGMIHHLRLYRKSKTRSLLKG